MKHVPSVPRGTIMRGVPAGGDRAPVTRKTIDRVGSRTKNCYCDTCGAKIRACRCPERKA